MERLGTFYEAMQAAEHGHQPHSHEGDSSDRTPLTAEGPWYYQSENKIAMKLFEEDQSNELILSIEHLNLKTPDAKRILIWDLNLNLQKGKNLLIVGKSGSGKSSLLRAIAGLWNNGQGTIERPSDEKVYFLPQRPYCAMGSLKDQLLYPSVDHTRDDWSDTSDSGQRIQPHSPLPEETAMENNLLDILEKIDMMDVALRAGDGNAKTGLRAKMDWSNVLSLGEQQRLAFGRLLVNRPELVILDEATSALDMASEDRMYKLLQSMTENEVTSSSGLSQTAGVTYISVGHRLSLFAYHNVRLQLKGKQGYTLEEIDGTSPLST